MTVDDNKALVRRFCTEVFEDGNLDAIEFLTTDDFADSSPASFGAGRDCLRQYVAFLHATFGEYRYTIHDQVADENNVVLFWTLHGTHHGHFLGLAPTGKPMNTRIVSLFRLGDGRVAEYRGHPDVWGTIAQLGATATLSMPEPV